MLAVDFRAGTPDQFRSVDPGIYGHLTRRNLAALAAERGHYAGVRRLWEDGIRRVPGDREALAKLGRLAGIFTPIVNIVAGTRTATGALGAKTARPVRKALIYELSAERRKLFSSNGLTIVPECCGCNADSGFSGVMPEPF